jgi:signal transduction histidine kinase
LNEEQKLSANRIEQASQRLQAIINDSLELVSAETGVKEIKIKKVNAKDILSSVTQKFEMAAKQKNIEIIEGSANAKIRADQGVVSSVLERLVENAVKFADGKIRDSVECR